MGFMEKYLGVCLLRGGGGGFNEGFQGLVCVFVCCLYLTGLHPHSPDPVENEAFLLKLHCRLWQCGNQRCMKEKNNPNFFFFFYLFGKLLLLELIFVHGCCEGIFVVGFCRSSDWRGWCWDAYNGLWAKFPACEVYLGDLCNLYNVKQLNTLGQV